MILDLLWPSIFIALAAALTYLCARVARSKVGFLKWGTAGLAGLGATAFGLLGLVALMGVDRLQARRPGAATPEQIDRGEAIASAFCGACHSRTGTLTAEGIWVSICPCRSAGSSRPISHLPGN